MQIYSDMCFKNPIETILAFDSKQLKTAFEKIEKLSNEYYLLGYIRYEAKDAFLNKNVQSKLPLLYFEAYKDFGIYESDAHAFAPLEIKPSITFSEYKKALETIKNEISNGNTYEVNYTYDWEVKSDCDEMKLFDYLLTRQKTPYNAYIKNDYETLMSFSPELFFELNGRNILTKPMKGTIARGKSEEEDKQNIDFLKNDIKNRAENVMIVDLLRNDLGKIAKTGTVKVSSLFDIETHKTLHQMTSTITAELKEDVTVYDIFEAIFPCGSITGAPKISTMQIIDEVEKGERNIYCGAIGFLSPEKSVFSVPIRILQKVNGKDSYKYRAGGAIVWDSEIKDEWEETITKTNFLKNNDYKLIETIKPQNGEFLYGKAHFERMEKSANVLGFKFNDDLKKLVPEKDGMVRILLSKNGSFEIEYKELLTTDCDFVRIADTKTISTQNFLYHKTTIRPWYEESFKKIKSNEVYDEIYFNEKGELTEGARSNVVLKLGGFLYTPPVSSGLLNGILRQKMVEERNLQEKVLYKTDLLNAEKIFCINSVRGIKEVHL